MTDGEGEGRDPRSNYYSGRCFNRRSRRAPPPSQLGVSGLSMADDEGEGRDPRSRSRAQRLRQENRRRDIPSQVRSGPSLAPSPIYRYGPDGFYAEAPHQADPWGSRRDYGWGPSEWPG